MTLRALIITLGLAAHAGASAADYPVRPIRLLTSGVGGNGDVTARLLAQGLTPKLGQQLIVDNRPSGFTSSEIAARAQADGYTLLVLGTTHWMSPLVQKVPYDAIRDFAPVTMVTITPNVLVISPSLAVSSVRELVDLAKAKPGYLNYGASGTGSSNHLAAELFKYMTGTNIVHVAYRSSSASMVDLIAGQIQLAFPTGAAAAPLVRAGRLKALAVTTADPSPSFPDLPTVTSAGVPGFESSSPIAVFAPAGTPPVIVLRLRNEIALLLGEPQVRERLRGTGAEPVGSTPEQLATKIRAEVERMSKVIKAAGIRAK